MKNILTIIVFATGTVCAQTGNLVQDPGFDDPAFVSPFICMPLPPNDCSPWTNIYSPAPELYATYLPEGTYGIPSNSHNGFFGYQFQTPDPPSGIPNTRYVFMFLTTGGLNKDGMSNHLASPLICGTTYKIEFDCSRHDELNGGTIQVVGRFGTNPANWISNGNTNDVFKANINSDDTGGANDDEWVPITFFYTPDRCDLEYLLLQTETPFTGTINKGVYIDNVRVTPVYVNCSSTKNCLDITYEGNHDFNHPFKVSGLGNFREATLRIYQTNNVLVRTIGPITNPSNSICWDGKADNGEEASGGIYHGILSGYNECVEEYESPPLDIDKSNNWGDPTTSDISQFPCLCYSSVSKPPEQCCADYFELENMSIVDDITIPGPITYSISGDIKFMANVTIPSTVCGIQNLVEFNAVNEINVNSMVVETGAQVTYDIHPCPMKPSNSSDIIHVLTNDSLKHFYDSLNLAMIRPLLSDGPLEVQIAKNFIEFEIIPNPASSSFSVYADFNQELICNCYNVLGRTFYSSSFVKNKEIDTSMWPRGNYFVNITDKSGRTIGQKKIVLQ